MSTQNTPLTVDELRNLLDNLSAAGHGNSQVVIPYNPGHATVGGRPTAAVTGGSNGIDWDNGKVFLHPSRELGAPTTDLLEQVQKSQQQLGRILLLSHRLGGERNGPLEDQIAHFKAAVEAIERPTSAKKMAR